MQDFSDEQLVVLARQANEPAFALLVQRYLSLIYNFSFYYLHNVQEAEDITQEIFIKVWKNLSKFDEQKSFRPWLYKIAKNTCLDFFKKKKIDPLAAWPEDIANNLAADSNLEKDFLSFDLHQEIIKTVAELPPMSAKIFSLHNEQQLTFAEISAKIKMPINTVKSRYHRALDFIKRRLTS